MKKLYMEVLKEQYQKRDKMADIITDTDAEINEVILKARTACRNKYKGKDDLRSRINFLICFEKTEATGLEEGLDFLKNNIKDCGDDSYCNKLLAEEIKFTQERVDLIKERLRYLIKKRDEIGD